MNREGKGLGGRRILDEATSRDTPSTTKCLASREKNGAVGRSMLFRGPDTRFGCDRKEDWSLGAVVHS